MIDLAIEFVTTANHWKRINVRGVDRVPRVGDTLELEGRDFLVKRVASEVMMPDHVRGYVFSDLVTVLCEEVE